MTVDAAAVSFVSVPWADARAVALRDVMDAEMNVRYALDDDGAPWNPEGVAATDDAMTVDPRDVLATVLALEADGTAIGHAVLRRFGAEFEVKRVIVTASARGRGVGARLMAELEAIALADGATRIILHTGNRQPEAMHLYEKIGYTAIPVYEPYATALPDVSRCYEKLLEGSSARLR